MRKKHRVKNGKRYAVLVKVLKVINLTVAFLLTFTFSLSTVTAQESINASGDNASGSGGSVSYSVGQVVYQSHTGSTGSITEGVQQPYEISVITTLEEAEGIALLATAFPNPTDNYLTLSIDDNVQTRNALSQLSFQLYDMNGNLLQSEKITGNQTSIVMSNLVPATYFVKVIQDQKEIKTFKIFKN